MRNTPLYTFHFLHFAIVFAYFAISVHIVGLRSVVESAALMAAYRLPRPNPKNLGIGHNRIWVKADKMGNKFSMINDHVTLRHTFCKYQRTREVRDKDWPNWLRKGWVRFTDGACNQRGTGAGI